MRPAWVLIENVAALRSRGLQRILQDLSTSGYDAEWDCIPAAAVGALHRRDRLFIVAYAKCQGKLQQERCVFQVEQRPCDSGRWSIEPDVARVAYGVPAGVDRLKCLGNAVVPQVAEHIGRLITCWTDQ